MKKFRFPLKPVLRAEEVALVEALAAHQELEQLLQLAEEARQALEQQLADQEREFLEQFRRDPRALALRSGRQQLRDHGERMRFMLAQRRGELEGLLELSQQRVAGHRREIARLEKVREGKFSEYSDLVKKSEQETLDELSLGLFARKKASAFPSS